MQIDGLDDLYQEIILDHYKSPRNRRVLEFPHLQGKGFNPFCGDQVELTAELDGEGRIKATGLHGQGCAISQASASIMGELVKGLSLKEAESLAGLFKSLMQGQEMTEEQEEQLGELAALEGVKRFPVRIKCALLAWSTLEDAIAEYGKTRGE
jgi:nitrogen fixation NifU-like protein